MNNGKYQNKSKGKPNQQPEQNTILVIPEGNEIKDLLEESASNLKLILEKYIPFYNIQNKRVLDISKAKEKVYELKSKNFQEADNYIKKLNERQRQIADKSFSLTTKSRLIVGLGGGSALEVSIKLHFIYGFPYIPSSAIKGVLRAYKILEKLNFDFEKYSKFEKEIESGDREDKEIGAFVRVFGNQQYKGDLIILDAIPENFPRLEEDIMNPHYPKYYNDKEPPTDDQNPVPIKFLTVAKGEKFNFYFKNSQVYKEVFKTDLNQDLIEAFNYLGIGAKTGIGYGMLDG
jgi:CRISPR-associated protein Cmr6